MSQREQRVAEARAALADLGLPPRQQNELAGLTLLALAGITPADPWTAARSAPTRPHDILAFINTHYNRDYKENTRETVRRQILHQFAQAAVVVFNADDPSRPTNSPNCNYRLTREAVVALRLFGTPRWTKAAETFRQNFGSLAELYRRPRETALIPVTLPSGEAFRLSPGAHNALQAAVIEEFAPRFAPGAEVLYFGDTAKKVLSVAHQELTRLGVPVTEHDKLPDIVLFLREKQLLILVEVVTSHGPVSPKRWEELEGVLSACPLRRIYVSVFATFAQFKRHIENIAWETEVWLQEAPDHMIHYNGERFLTPLQ